MYMTGDSLVGLAFGATGDEASGADSRTVFVESGIPKNIRPIGLGWEFETEYIEIYGKKSLLYAGCGIGRNDFHLRAKLSICSEGDKPNFVVGTNNIGISGFQRLSYVFWPREVLGHQQMAFSADWVTPGVPFNFEIVRKGTRVVIIVDGTAVKHFLFGGELTRFGFCSYEGTLRVHDFYPFAVRPFRSTGIERNRLISPFRRLTYPRKNIDKLSWTSRQDNTSVIRTRC